MGQEVAVSVRDGRAVPLFTDSWDGKSFGPLSNMTGRELRSKSQLAALVPCGDFFFACTALSPSRLSDIVFEIDIDVRSAPHHKSQ